MCAAYGASIVFWVIFTQVTFPADLSLPDMPLVPGADTALRGRQFPPPHKARPVRHSDALQELHQAHLVQRAPPTTMTSWLGGTPFAWGTHRSGASSGSVSGLTPACAGNTGWSRQAWAGRRTHPRLRGEHKASRPKPAARWDSPPLARGTHRLGRVLTVWGGLTPACAGNTPAGTRAHRLGRTHPRLREEHPVPGRWCAAERTNPRLRGRTACRRKCRVAPGRTTCSSLRRID